MSQLLLLLFRFYRSFTGLCGRETLNCWSTFLISNFVCLQGLKAATESPLPENEKKDTLLGLYWAAQMASTYASAACNTK